MTNTKKTLVFKAKGLSELVIKTNGHFMKEQALISRRFQWLLRLPVIITSVKVM